VNRETSAGIVAKWKGKVGESNKKGKENTEKGAKSNKKFYIEKDKVKRKNGRGTKRKQNVHTCSHLKIVKRKYATIEKARYQK
jgi:hypothetical protein